LSVGLEALFTSALGLQPPWVVEHVKLDVSAKRIDFEVSCSGALLSCPACGAASQPVHDRLRRSSRHLDFFQFEAWLHADMPRVACSSCGKTNQLSVPWARPGSGFTAAFEALALALCRELPVRQAAALLRCNDKQFWRRIEFYVDQARALESLEDVQIVGIDETSLRRGQHYITVVHDLDAKRLLFATEGRDHQTVLDFAADLKAHGGDPAEVRHVCMAMSAAYAKGSAQALPAAPSATTASTSSRWPSRRWTMCDARSCEPSPLRWPQRCLARTPGRGATCCGECARTPADGPWRRPTRCTGCSARC
jgi:transposase